MVFKILKQEAQAPEYCDYVKKKIDIAAAKGVIYELEPEDLRIDALYKDTNLYTEKRLISVDRVLVNRKEYLVAAYEVAFFNIDTNKQVDRYIDYEGRSVDPTVIQDPKTNAQTVTPTGTFVYDIPFSPAKVDEFINTYGGAEPNEFRYYAASTSPTRKVTPVEVKRKEFFKNASWDELLIGKEKRYTSSTTNKLPTLRKELAYEENQGGGGAASSDNNESPNPGTSFPLKDVINQTNNTNDIALKNNDIPPPKKEESLPVVKNNDEEVTINNKNPTNKKPLSKQ